jgi:hypothetical protein
MLENVAICITPSGFRLSAETHPWGWHPRLLLATPPAFRTIEGPTSCRPPRIPANLAERTARRSLPATFVGGVQLFRKKWSVPRRFPQAFAIAAIRTQGKTPHPQPLSPKRGEGSKVKKMWVKMRVLTPGAIKSEIQALEGRQGCWHVGKRCDMCHPLGVQASRGNRSLGFTPQAIACHASSVPNLRGSTVVPSASGDLQGLWVEGTWNVPTTLIFVGSVVPVCKKWSVPRRFLKSGRHGGACLLLLSVGSAWCLGHERFANLVFDARLGEDLLVKTHGCDFVKSSPKASDILHFEGRSSP